MQPLHSAAQRAPEAAARCRETAGAAPRAAVPAQLQGCSDRLLQSFRAPGCAPTASARAGVGTGAYTGGSTARGARLRSRQAQLRSGRPSGSPRPATRPCICPCRLGQGPWPRRAVITAHSAPASLPLIVGRLKRAGRPAQRAASKTARAVGCQEAVQARIEATDAISVHDRGHHEQLRLHRGGAAAAAHVAAAAAALAACRCCAA